MSGIPNDWQEMLERVAEVKGRNALWLKQWPNHCEACGGWGGHEFTQSHGPGLNERMFEPCEATRDTFQCHRCGEYGLNEDGSGPCAKCGWNYDDGLMPEEP